MPSSDKFNQSIDVGFVGGSNLQRSSQFSSEQAINCYPFYDSVSESRAQYAYAGSQEILQFNTASPTAIGRKRGALTVGDISIWIVGDEVFVMTSSFTPSSVGTIGSNIGAVSLCCGGDYVLIVDGTGGWTYQISTSTLAQITAPAFPVSPTSCTEQQGYFLVNNEGTQELYQSAPYDPTVWEVLNSVVVNYRSCTSSFPLLSLRSCNGRIFAFTSGFIQVYANAGKVGFTFRPDQNLIFGYGALNDQSTVQSVGGNQGEQQPEFIIFISVTNDGTKKVMMTSGNPPRVISTPSIDYRINQLNNPDDAEAFIWTENGQTFWICSWTIDDLTIAYNMTNGSWFDIQNGNKHRYFVTAFSFFKNKALALSYKDHKLYELTESLFTEQGQPRPLIRVTPQLRAPQYRNIVGKILDIYFQQGDALSGALLPNSPHFVYGAEPAVFLYVSIDGGRTFQEPIRGRLARIGIYSFSTRFTSLGSYHSWTFKLIIRAPIPVYITDSQFLVDIVESTR